MKFKTYPKINRLGKEETDGILTGVISVSEKIDGANLSVWLDEGVLHVGSRNNDLTENGNTFNGAVEYCNKHKGIQSFLAEYPNCRLYGEWLVRHTLSYNETAYKKFYLFDIWNETTEVFFPQEEVQKIAKEYSIEVVPDLGVYTNPSLEELTKLMEGKSDVGGDKKEGIVLKNLDYINKFGELSYAKIVSESFKEDNGVIFGGNNKHSDTYWEMYIVNKYIDVARVQKIMNKIQPLVEERLDMKHIPRIMGTVYHDVITEEAWEIANKVQSVNYTNLQRVAYKKIKQVYVDILNNNISVADIR